MGKIAEHLHELGVENVYFGAGSRNSSLLDEFKEFKTETYFDERVLSFKALGMAKMSAAPIAICLTSGTSLAECLPALIEAYYSGEKLIVISADRPKRLHHTNAPQTINQLDLFRPYIRSQYTGTIQDFSCKAEIQFPYQINLEIDDAKTPPFTESIIFKDFKDVVSLLNVSKKPVFLFSEGSFENQELLTLVDSLNIPSYVESLSRLKRVGTKNAILSDNDLINYVVNNSVDLIIRIGKTPISKLWRLLDSELDQVDVICLNSETTGLGRGAVSKLNIEMAKADINQKATPDINNKKAKELPTFLERFSRAEPAMIFNELSSTTRENSLFYFGNSMPIRYGELLWDGLSTFMANRGANGIDGQISTAIGIAQSTNKEVYAFIGDLTFLYDFSALFYHYPTNLHLICIDNNGGRIFERVNVDKRMICSPDVDLKGLVSIFKGKDIKIIKPCNEQTNIFWKEWKQL